MADTTVATTKQVADYWWVLLLQGAITAFIGWVLLARPIPTLDVLVSVLGLYWMIMGIVDIVKSIMSAVNGGAKWGWQLFGGLIGLIAGMVVLNNQTLAMILLPGLAMYFVAFSFIINGIINMAVGRNDESSEKYQWSWGSFLLGALYLLLGMGLLGMPTIVATATVVFSFGLLAIGGGIAMMIMSFMVKGSGKAATK